LESAPVLTSRLLGFFSSCQFFVLTEAGEGRLSVAKHEGNEELTVG